MFPENRGQVRRSGRGTDGELDRKKWRNCVSYEGKRKILNENCSSAGVWIM